MKCIILNIDLNCSQQYEAEWSGRLQPTGTDATEQMADGLENVYRQEESFTRRFRHTTGGESVS